MIISECGAAENLSESFDYSPLHKIPHQDLNDVKELASNILKELMPFRRLADSQATCSDAFCADCMAPHLHKVVSAINQNKPVSFVLPAFPGKSPNLAKVFSPLPDMAEKLALSFLNELCERIKSVYAPGAEIILCSDGRVFSDVIGIEEDHITTYQAHIQKIVDEAGLKNIKTYTLDELSAEQDFNRLRQHLVHQYGQSLETLRQKVVRDGETHRMYCGMVRFLVEDSSHPGQTKSRNAIQKDCKVRAYEVIRRSNAWSELIAERFPQAVRLSIHPQSCGSRKMGIQLLGTETWMTPWHGVAVDTANGFVLMKRWEAEKMSVQLIEDQHGRPSHYKLQEENDVLETSLA